MAWLFVFGCVWLRENVRAVEHEREREREWLTDRRRWRETTTSIQEGLSSSSTAAWTRRARAAAHAGCVCV